MTERPRLLLVDDEESNRDMLSRRLARHGYEVVQAPGGREALAELDRVEPDLVLLDIQMPEMSGLETLKAIRSRFPINRLPVIMATAKTQSEDIVEALELGANDYVTKPVDMAVTVARIKTQLARCKAERALGESEERYALAVRGANDGLWDWKIDDSRVYLSPRWKEILGFADDELPNDLASWLDRVHGEDLDRLRSSLDEHLAGATAQLENEHRLRHRSGDYRWVLVRGVAIRGADGRAVRLAGSLTDITEGKVADALTGLPNRVLFVDRLSRLLELARRRPDLRFAVLFLDLDRFKNINDSLGHLAGDDVLTQVARRLEACLRATDTVSRMAGGTSVGHRVGHTVARLGGDEFAIILAALSDAGETTKVAARIMQVFADPFPVAGQEVFVSASIGIAVGTDQYATPDDLLRDADTAMYHAKAAGRARVEFFDESMREEALRRLQVENDLRHALERGEFVLHYQPIVSLNDTRTMGLEALIRWNHPTRGLLAPAEFVGVAEETGLIVPIGYWVLEEACRQLRAWMDHDPPLPPFTVSVNLSARQLAQPDLVPRVLAITGSHGVLPRWIEFEITESSVMTNPVEAEGILARLKAEGFRLAIDDFGTGYSSLNYVHRFPVDRLKIDRSFLGEAENGQCADGADGILATILQMAHQLKLEVVAEGVESKEHLDQLRLLHCELGQGYYFANPVGLPGAEEYLPRSLPPGAKKAG